MQLDTAASVSRIGGRALSPALRDLALAARLEIVQAVDAHEFSASKSDPATAAALRKASQLQAALTQLPGQYVPLEEQVAAFVESHQALQHCFLAAKGLAGIKWGTHNANRHDSDHSQNTLCTGPIIGAYPCAVRTGRGMIKTVD